MENTKIILVHYINIANLNSSDIDKFMNHVISEFKAKQDDNIFGYYIPVRDSDTRVECINPQLVDEDKYSKAVEVLEKAQKEMFEAIKKIKKEE